MKIIKNKIDIDELKQMAEHGFGGLVKAVVDLEKAIMAVDAPLHVDEEQVLLESGSEQKDLWGINIYPEVVDKEGFIEFDSMINLRPWQGNKSRGVDDKNIQQKIIKIVDKLVEK